MARQILNGKLIINGKNLKYKDSIELVNNKRH